MCGRFYLDADFDEIMRRFGAAGAGGSSWVRGQVYPTQEIPVLYQADAPVLEVMRWGWHVTAIRRPIINARVESLLVKPLFRRAAASQRCIIPASAYFEWKAEPGAKTRHRIGVRDWPLFGMAGIYQAADLSTGLKQVTVLTRPAAPAIAGIHDRMPVILPPGREWEYLNEHLQEQDLTAFCLSEEWMSGLEAVPDQEDKPYEQLRFPLEGS